MSDEIPNDPRSARRRPRTIDTPLYPVSPGGSLDPIPTRPLAGGFWPRGQSPTTDEGAADLHYLEATGRMPIDDAAADFADRLRTGDAPTSPWTLDTATAHYHRHGYWPWHRPRQEDP